MPGRVSRRFPFSVQRIVGGLGVAKIDFPTSRIAKAAGGRAVGQLLFCIGIQIIRLGGSFDRGRDHEEAYRVRRQGAAGSFRM